MATKKQPVVENNAAPADEGRSPAALSASSQRDVQMAEQMDELTKLVNSLKATVQEAQARSMQDTAFKGAIGEIMRVASTIPTAVGPAAIPHPVPAQNDCDDCGCGCVNSGCCCFEIVFDKVRAIQPQLEPADSGEIAGLHNNLEVVIFASVGGRGIIVPSLSSTMDLSVGSIALGGKPGPWVPVDRVIDRICLKKGTTQSVLVDFEAGEIDKGLERPAGLKDEYGQASGTIVLDCCVSKIYPAMPTDLSFEFVGTGGGVPGMISMAFYARRVCC